MSKTMAQLQEKGVVIRHYKHGDEAQIVAFLNVCFGDWGTLQKWKALYAEYPTFNEKNVFIIEQDHEIIGHEALHFRDLIMGDKRALSTVSLSDAAVHPNYRGQGLHNKLVDIMLQEARSRDAGLVFSWYLRDSGLHKHAKKIGFIEIKQPPAYMKVIRPEKLLRSGLLDFLHKSPGFTEVLGDLSNDLYFRFGEFTFSMAELFGKADQKSVMDRRKVEVTFNESSIFTLVKFRNMNKRQRFWNLILLIILRRAKVRFGSFRAFVKFVRRGMSIIGSI